MKKLAVSLIIGASLIVSPNVFALTLMTEAEMKAATGQAGVEINIDYLVFEQSIRAITYTDEDGTNGVAGSVVIKDQHFVKIYKAVVSATDYAAQFTADTNGVAPVAIWTKFAPLSINVGKCNVLSEIAQKPITGVVVGLPTLIINTTTEDYSVGVAMTGAVNDGKDFIHVKTANNTMAILNGTIEIAPH